MPLSESLANHLPKEIHMSKSNIYAVGDIVKLKSGGPEMTVRTVPTEMVKFYRCQWFAGKKLEQGDFPGESLETVKKP